MPRDLDNRTQITEIDYGTMNHHTIIIGARQPAINDLTDLESLCQGASANLHVNSCTVGYLVLKRAEDGASGRSAPGRSARL